LQKKHPKTARFVAIETLLQLFQRRLPVKYIFDKSLQKHKLPSKDRNLAMQLVYGVLRNRQYLDRILQLLSKTPLSKIDPFVHQALAVGLFQLYFLERIPESAAVNEVINSCKAAKVPKRLHGFVNGILRQSIRQKQHLAQKAVTDEHNVPILNHPDWLIKKWQTNFGVEEARRICMSNNAEPLLVLRINVCKITRNDFFHLLEQADITYQPGSYTKNSVVLPNFRGSVLTIPGYTEGFFQVQAEAAQLATELLAPFKQNGHYLDGCAGLGGKTSHLLELGQQSHLHIHAVEPDSRRLMQLQENLARLDANHNITIHSKKLQVFEKETSPVFNGILIDVPCSGTGVTGRHPDIRWNRRNEDFEGYRKEQSTLLEIASRLLAPQGILVYATCSLEPEENRDVINAFLLNHSEFVLTDCAPFLPKQAHQCIEDGFFSPHPCATIDGFFAARLQRR
jgi:16S rRNA (cytosine967-C5)-methyltransferase